MSLFDDDVSNYLEGLSAESLIGMRESMPKDSPMQSEIAPYEHQAFTRDVVAEGGPLSALSMAIATPAYTTAKMFAMEPLLQKAFPSASALARTAVQYAGGQEIKPELDPDTSPPSLQEVYRGYKGIAQGIRSWFK